MLPFEVIIIRNEFSPLIFCVIGPKHSKRQKTGSEEIESVVAGVLVALCSGNQKGQKYLIWII